MPCAAPCIAGSRIAQREGGPERPGQPPGIVLFFFFFFVFQKKKKNCTTPSCETTHLLVVAISADYSSVGNVKIMICRVFSDSPEKLVAVIGGFKAENAAALGQRTS